MRESPLCQADARLGMDARRFVASAVIQTSIRGLGSLYCDTQGLHQVKTRTTAC